MTVEEYGVYELIGSIIAYLSVMDMGLSTTLTRFYVKEGYGGPERLSNLLAVAAIIYLALTLLAVAACLGVNELINPMFGDSFTRGELSLAHSMMVLVVVNCIVVLPGNWFLAIINAEEQFVFARSISIIKYILQVVVVLLVLSRSPNAIYVLAIQVLFNGLAIICYAVFVYLKIRPKVALRRWDWAMFRQLATFSFFILLGMVFDQIFWKTGQVVLGAVCGASAVAVYGIACKFITSAYMQMSTGVTSVFLPKLTSIVSTTSDMKEINELFCRIGRIQAMLVWGFMGGFAVLGYRFIVLWAGGDMIDAYYAILILMIGLCISLIQNLGISILQAKNKLGFRSTVYLILAIMDLVISIPVSQVYGVVGCAATAAVILFIGTGPIMNLYYKYRIGIDLAQFYRAIAPIVVPVFLTAFVTGLVQYFVPVTWGWGGLGLLCFVFIGVYLLLLRAWWMNEYEKGLVDSLVRVIFKKI